MERYMCSTCLQPIARGLAHHCGQAHHNTPIPSQGTGMNVAATGGLRDNEGKPRLSLVPSELEEAVAHVIWKSSDQAGGKYPLQNWRKGLPWSEVAESAIRHLKAFAQRGEDTDPETGLDHLAHAACNLAFLLWYRKNRPALDDRYKGDGK